MELNTSWETDSYSAYTRIRNAFTTRMFIAVFKKISTMFPILKDMNPVHNLTFCSISIFVTTLKKKCYNFHKKYKLIFILIPIFSRREILTFSSFLLRGLYSMCSRVWKFVILFIKKLVPYSEILRNYPCLFEVTYSVHPQFESRPGFLQLWTNFSLHFLISTRKSQDFISVRASVEN
jgi:hypothetical protein